MHLLEPEKWGTQAARHCEQIASDVVRAMIRAKEVSLTTVNADQHVRKEEGLTVKKKHAQ